MGLTATFVMKPRSTGSAGEVGAAPASHSRGAKTAIVLAADPADPGAAAATSAAAPPSSSSPLTVTEVAASALVAEPPSTSSDTSDDDFSFEDAPSHADWLEEAAAAAEAAAGGGGGPSTPPPSPEDPPLAADLAAHAAAFAGDVPGTLAALRALPPHLRGAVDPVHGNTVLQVAALRGHAPLVEALLGSGLARASDRGARRWTALDEAVLRSNAAVTSALAAAQVAEAKAARASARAALAAALASAPDFCASIKWEFGSPVLGPLLRAVAPHDTYTVWKVGSALRIDGTLRGLDGPGTGGGGGGSGGGPALPSWRRGAFSLVWHAPSTASPSTSPSPATAWLVDRERNSYVDLAAERRAVLRDSGTGGGAAGAAEVAARAAVAAAGTRARLVTGPLTFTPARAWLGLGGRSGPVKVAGGYTALPFEVSLPLSSEEAARGRLEVDGMEEGEGEGKEEGGAAAAAAAAWARYLATPPVPDTTTVQAVDPLAAAGMPGRGSAGGGGLTARAWLAGPDFPLPGSTLAAVLEVAAAASPHLAPLGRFARRSAAAAAKAAAAAAADARRKDGKSCGAGGGGDGGGDPTSPSTAAAGGVAVRFHLPLALTVYASLSITAASRLGPGDEAVRKASTWFGLPPACRLKAAEDLALGRVATHAAASASAARAAGGGGGGAVVAGRSATTTASTESGAASPHLARLLLARRHRTESTTSYSSTVGDEWDGLEF